MTELRPAYEWTCENCGRDQFTSGIVPSFSQEELEELRLEYGMTPWETGVWMQMPLQVTCQFCHETFDTVHYGEDDL